MEGESCLIFRDDLESLAGSSASHDVRLLSGYDQWILGPGTDNAYLVPPARRTPIARGANLVLAGGVVSGMWTVKEDEVVISWFTEAGRLPRQKLEAEADRLTAILGDDLRVILTKD